MKVFYFYYHRTYGYGAYDTVKAVVIAPDIEAARAAVKAAYPAPEFTDKWDYNTVVQRGVNSDNEPEVYELDKPAVVYVNVDTN